VQRDQNRVRVNAQLIDAETGGHIWADRFEADIADLFKLQNDVVARLGNSIGFELMKAEARSGARKVNPDAIDITMRGQYLLFLFGHQQTKENLYGARAQFEQALKIDPDDADALAGDAVTYMLDFFYGWTNSATDYGAKILAQADRSIALAPNVPGAYVAKGIYLAGLHRPDEAVKVMDAGLAANPNSALLYGNRAVVEAYLFRYEQMISDARQAMRLSPLDPQVGVWHWLLGFAELGLGRFDAAVEEDHEAINAGWVSFLPYRDMAAAFAMQGKMDEARSAVAEARRLNPQLTMKLVIETAPNVPALLEGLRKAGLPEE
jgi:tetratricopeptide (TPR) repeat protein